VLTLTHACAAAEITDAGERLAQLKDLISKLPEDRRNILHRLVQSLVLIAENSEENKMNASNLAIVFGPSLLKAESDGLDILFKIRAQCLVVENCILHHATIFLVRTRTTAHAHALLTCMASPGS
jgi:hypothetical protein